MSGTARGVFGDLLVATFQFNRTLFALALVEPGGARKPESCRAEPPIKSHRGNHLSERREREGLFGREIVKPFHDQPNR